MKILTNNEMREADAYTIKTLGVPSLVLMERAGTALSERAEKLAPTGRILCVCGGGNNGGDGFVCARILKSRGRKTSVVFYAERVSEDCRANMEKWIELGGEILSEIPKDGAYALAVDCLFGTGFHGGLEGKNAQTVAAINALKKSGMKILAADIPSGLCGENGLAEGEAIQADVTLCIGEAKAGVVLGDGLDCAGKTERADIGICLPPSKINAYADWIDADTVKELLPQRKRNSHKGTYGRAAIVAGSMQYTGAAYLSAAACLRSGAGYTALFAPAELLPYYVLKAPEILLKKTNEGGRYEFNEEYMLELLGYDSIAYGMGMGVSAEVAKGARFLMERYEGRLILDADGLNSLAEFARGELESLFSNKKCDVLLTPHVKEFSRLSGKTVREIVAEGVYAGRDFARQLGVTLLLKNAATVITDGARTAVNTVGNSGQAKGGSGDVLSGVLAGLCAMGLPLYRSACAGAYITGLAAELAAEKTGEYSLTATDVIAYLGASFLKILI